MVNIFHLWGRNSYMWMYLERLKYKNLSIFESSLSFSLFPGVLKKKVFLSGCLLTAFLYSMVLRYKIGRIFLQSFWKFKLFYCYKWLHSFRPRQRFGIHRHLAFKVSFFKVHFKYTDPNTFKMVSPFFLS